MVTGTGELVRLGRRTAKGVAGFDLAGLMVGSEGALGIVTEVTVRLRPAAPGDHRGRGLRLAGRRRPAVRAVGAAGITPAALELVDRHCLQAVDAWKNMGLSVRRRGRAAGPRRRSGRHRRGDRPTGSSSASETAGAVAGGPVDRRGRGRGALRRAPAGLSGARGLGPVLTEDVCVPKEGRALRCSAGRGSSPRGTTSPFANIAHAGDGNLHPLIIAAPGDDDARVRAQARLRGRSSTPRISLGGTVTGEHGVGLLKRGGLRARDGRRRRWRCTAPSRPRPPPGHPQPRQGVRPGGSEHRVARRQNRSAGRCQQQRSRLPAADGELGHQPQRLTCRGGRHLERKPQRRGEVAGVHRELEGARGQVVVQPHAARERRQEVRAVAALDQRHHPGREPGHRRRRAVAQRLSGGDAARGDTRPGGHRRGGRGGQCRNKA